MRSVGEDSASLFTNKTLLIPKSRTIEAANFGQGCQSVDTAVEMNRNGDRGSPVPDYIEENISTKAVKIVRSCTAVVNKMVWRKF